MTPMEALKILDGLCAQVQLNREQHAKVQEATTVLYRIINPKPVTATQAE